jgi:hypothetical protein
MSAPSVAVFRPRRGIEWLTAAEANERWIQSRVGITWGLLFLNVLAFAPDPTLLHIPRVVGQIITQGSLPLALIVALTVNRRVIVRPNVFLSLVSLLAVEGILTCLEAQYFRSTVYRTFRFTEFIAGLWLLSPYWGRRDLLIVRCHLRALWVVLGSVLIGLLVAPGKARPTGRLSGILWPIPATQVGHYAGVTLGLVVILWLCSRQRGRASLLAVVATAGILILTHTRTALVAAIAGILIAGLSLIATEARVRRLFAITGTVAAIGTLTLSGVITTWLVRGQSSQQLLELTGRTKFWGALLAFPRNKFQEIFGFGMGNATFGGLPIDSNWIASYQEEGLFGVIVCAAIIIFLYVTAYFQPRGLQRARALFLITYCFVASFTEIGFTDVTPYLLDLTVAASLLVPSVATSDQNKGSANIGLSEA